MTEQWFGETKVEGKEQLKRRRHCHFVVLQPLLHHVESRTPLFVLDAVANWYFPVLMLNDPTLSQVSLHATRQLQMGKNKE